MSRKVTDTWQKVEAGDQNSNPPGDAQRFPKEKPVSRGNNRIVRRRRTPPAVPHEANSPPRLPPHHRRGRAAHAADALLWPHSTPTTRRRQHTTLDAQHAGNRIPGHPADHVLPNGIWAGPHAVAYAAPNSVHRARPGFGQGPTPSPPLHLPFTQLNRVQLLQGMIGRLLHSKP